MRRTGKLHLSQGVCVQVNKSNQRDRSIDESIIKNQICFHGINSIFIFYIARKFHIGFHERSERYYLHYYSDKLRSDHFIEHFYPSVLKYHVEYSV